MHVCSTPAPTFSLPSFLFAGVLTTCEINAMEEGDDALDLAALATAFRASNEVQSGRHAHTHPYIHGLSVSSTPSPPPPLKQ